MRIAFIGGWGHSMLRPLLTDASAGVTAVAWASDGHDPVAARARCESVKATWFDDARHMLDTFKPDYVDVGAVYGLNNHWILEAMNRGLPACSDKPIATTWEELAQLQQAAKQHPQAQVVTTFAFRSAPAIRAARKAIAEGRIGKVVLANGQKSYRFGNGRPAWYADRKLYGGTILWVAGHAIDFVRFATGLPYTRAMFGRHVNLSKPSYGSMEEVTVNVLELQGGAPAIIHSDYNRPAKAPSHGDDRLRVMGASGTIEVRDERCMLISHEQEPVDITDEAGSPDATLEMLAGLRGDTSLYGTTHSLEMAQVMLACRDAADFGRPVPLA